jgi:hypothetical protein
MAERPAGLAESTARAGRPPPGQSVVSHEFIVNALFRLYSDEQLSHFFYNYSTGSAQGFSASRPVLPAAPASQPGVERPSHRLRRGHQAGAA